MLQDHNKLLYPTCEDGQKNLGSTLELLKWKAETGVTDSSFEKLLVLKKKASKKKQIARQHGRSKEAYLLSRIRRAEDTCMP
jgi:hypothetical protein